MRTMREVLEAARKRRVGIGHFNFSDLTSLRAVVSAARQMDVPVVVGVSEGEREFIGVRQAAALVRSFREEYGVSIFLNADHTHSLRNAEEAAHAGFDEILFDGSGLPFDKNVSETKRAVEAIKSINPAILVEGEVGYIGTSSSILDEPPKGLGDLTDPAEAVHFVSATGIDVLSPAVGNMHGMLRSMIKGETKKRLDIKRIGDISKATGILMTLHGASGTDDDDLRQAIRAGITLIHINTEIRVAWRRGVEATLSKHPDEVAPYKILPGALDAVKEIVSARIKLFNSPGI